MHQFYKFKKYFQILQENYKNVEAGLFDEFIIDNTLGRDLKFTIDKSKTGSINVIQIISPNGTSIFYHTGTFDDTFSTKFDFLEV